MTKYEKKFIKACKDYEYAIMYLFYADYSSEDIDDLNLADVIKNGNKLEKTYAETSYQYNNAMRDLMMYEGYTKDDIYNLQDKAEEELLNDPSWLILHFRGDRLKRALLDLA